MCVGAHSCREIAKNQLIAILLCVDLRDVSQRSGMRRETSGQGVSRLINAIITDRFSITMNAKGDCGQVDLRTLEGL